MSSFSARLLSALVWKICRRLVCQLSANEHARRLLRVYMITDAADVCQRQRVNYYQVRCRPSVSGKDKPHIENTLRKAKDIG